MVFAKLEVSPSLTTFLRGMYPTLSACARVETGRRADRRTAQTKQVLKIDFARGSMGTKMVNGKRTVAVHHHQDVVPALTFVAR
jgi:hypothetical protein